KIQRASQFPILANWCCPASVLRVERGLYARSVADLHQDVWRTADRGAAPRLLGAKQAIPSGHYQVPLPLSVGAHARPLYENRSRPARTERSQAGTAGTDGNPPLRLPRPMGRTKHWRTGRGAPDRPDGSKYQCCERQYRTARHRPDLAPSAPDRILQGPTTWTR